MPVRALWFRNGTLHLLDQRRLPGKKVTLHLTRVEEVADAIRTLAVRGAPSIGVAAAYGMVLAARQGSWTPRTAAELLGATRPTAYDLFVGIDWVRAAWSGGLDPLAAADAYREKVVGECHAIGEAGASLFGDGSRILTHCNAGALATVEWGTALAPIRVARDRGNRVFVWVDETRPLLQGSRLTAWELDQEKIPHAVIVDSAGGHFMRIGEVDAVIVGADRIALNGDFANKIGTYEKAVLAHENRLPFYVAAPWSTFDPNAATGKDIPVEQRAVSELQGEGNDRTSPRRSGARNPAFDVTPARYVTRFVTPGGLLRPREIARAVRSRMRMPTPSDARNVERAYKRGFK